MLPGVYSAKKKDGTIYYRSSITYKSKHISLGSFDSEYSANQAYIIATEIIKGSDSIENSFYRTYALPFEKIVSLINFRDNNMYIPTPIYLRKNYFSYYLDIGIAHICAVAIFKYVIFAAYSMRFYAEAT